MSFVGETRIVAGVAMISNGLITLPYPETAHDLIQCAMAHGWGFDDGIPVRVSSDGVPFVRVLIGREPGKNALYSDEPSPGIQFHITWRMPHPVEERNRRSWTLGEMYVKTSDEQTWRRVTTLKAVRHQIASNPVKVPSPYVTANH